MVNGQWSGAIEQVHIAFTDLLRPLSQAYIEEQVAHRLPFRRCQTTSKIIDH